MLAALRVYVSEAILLAALFDLLVTGFAIGVARVLAALSVLLAALIGSQKMGLFWIRGRIP